jgi:hypothetical protein
LGDRYQVLMDGRTQVYSPQFWEAMYMRPKDELAHSISTLRADAAILPASHRRLRDGLILLGWRRAYCDERAEVLVPPTAQVATIQEDTK